MHATELCRQSSSQRRACCDGLLSPPEARPLISYPWIALIADRLHRYPGASCGHGGDRSTMAPLWLLRPVNPWLGRFLPGLLIGYLFKVWLDKEAKVRGAGRWGRSLIGAGASRLLRRPGGMAVQAHQLWAGREGLSKRCSAARHPKAGRRRRRGQRRGGGAGGALHARLAPAAARAAAHRGAEDGAAGPVVPCKGPAALGLCSHARVAMYCLATTSTARVCPKEASQGRSELARQRAALLLLGALTRACRSWW